MVVISWYTVFIIAVCDGMEYTCSRILLVTKIGIAVDNLKLYFPFSLFEYCCYLCRLYFQSLGMQPVSSNCWNTTDKDVCLCVSFFEYSGLNLATSINKFYFSCVTVLLVLMLIVGIGGYAKCYCLP